MIPIKGLLNKIKWDKNLNPEEYSIFYKDLKEKKEIRFNDIKRIEGSFFVLEKDGEEIFIPLHRIKEVRKNKRLVWERN